MKDYGALWSPDVESRLYSSVKNMDTQKRGPSEIVMCKRCVMTNQRPRITFNSDGICSACQYADYQNNVIDWVARRNEFEELIMSTSKPIICPSSGGKDSTYVALTLGLHNMDVILARWHPLIITQEGMKNWDSVIEYGFDGITGQPGKQFQRKLARVGLEFYGDPFLPFIYGQLSWPFHVANEFGADIVFFGENGEALYGGDISANDKKCWDKKDWERVYQKGAGLSGLVDILLGIGAVGMDYVTNASIMYSMPRTNAEFHWMSYYFPWHPQQNYYDAATECGFEPKNERSVGTYSRYASLDDKMDGLHYFFGWLKFGIGRCTSDAAHEIRDGELTREEGLGLVSKYDGEFPWEHYEECLSYLGMTHEKMSLAFDRFNLSGVDWRAKHRDAVDKGLVRADLP